jgi:hypothetical protein
MKNPLVYITYHASSGPCGLLLLGKTPIAGTYDDDEFVTHIDPNYPGGMRSKIALLETALSETLGRTIACKYIELTEYDLSNYNFDHSGYDPTEEADIVLRSDCLLEIGLYSLGEIPVEESEDDDIFAVFEKTCNDEYEDSCETEDTPTSKGVSVVQGVFIAPPAEPKRIEIIEEFPEIHVDAALEDFPTCDLLDELDIRDEVMLCSLTDDQIATALYEKGFDDTQPNIDEVKHFLRSVVNPEHYLNLVQYALINLSLRFTLDKR